MSSTERQGAARHIQRVVSDNRLGHWTTLGDQEGFTVDKLEGSHGRFVGGPGVRDM